MNAKLRQRDRTATGIRAEEVGLRAHYGTAVKKFRQSEKNPEPD